MLERFSTIGLPKKFQPLPSSGKACIPWDETVGSSNGPENALWYFREDLLINAQHIFWHMVHPNGLGQINASIPADRRAELFYYFHRNILARYDAERLSFGFDRVKAMTYEEGILLPMGYDPHFHANKTLYRYPSRVDNMPFVDITYNTDGLRFLEADIDNRTLLALNGTWISLSEEKGLGLLSDCVEASNQNVNKVRYTSYGVHNNGQSDIGLLSEDDGGELTLPVMLNPSTAMRDPAFYAWHKLVDDLFYRHQAFLTPNHPVEGEFPLRWTGVSMDSISVQSDHQHGSNYLRTYFKTENLSLPLLEDVFRSEDITDYCMKRLHNEHFSYNISISKQILGNHLATVRIFMAPRFNETGIRFGLLDQTRQFFALDSFTVELTLGTNIITRNSSSSLLNLKWTLENWADRPPSQENPECGCGWPSHLLLPKGTTGGMTFDLFSMVTDAEVDRPSSPNLHDAGTPRQQEPECRMSPILCGISGKKYPDMRPMGYPFNTPPFIVPTPEGRTRMVADLEEFVNLVPNSNAVQVVIKHDETDADYNSIN